MDFLLRYLLVIDFNLQGDNFSVAAHTRRIKKKKRLFFFLLWKEEIKRLHHLISPGRWLEKKGQESERHISVRKSKARVTLSEREKTINEFFHNFLSCDKKTTRVMGSWKYSHRWPWRRSSEERGENRSKRSGMLVLVGRDGGPSPSPSTERAAVQLCSFSFLLFERYTHTYCRVRSGGRKSLFFLPF